MFNFIVLCLVVFCLFSYLPGSVIHTMIDEDDAEGIRREISLHPELMEEKNEYVVSPLNYAVNQGKLNMVELLINSGADIYSGDREGSQPLINAAATGSMEITRYLIEHGAEIDLMDDNNNTALCFALVRKHSQVASYLLSQGANPDLAVMSGLPGLFFAVVNNDLPLVKLMIEKNATIDVTNASGITPLFSACIHGHLDMVKYLVSQGANIEKEDDQGRTPIFFAAMRGQNECVEYLITRGADLNKISNNGETPLFYATGDLATIKLLQEHGADIHKLNDDGSNILINTGWNSTPEAVSYLAKEIDVNQVNKYGTSGYYFAIQQDSLAIVRIFLENGADPDFGCKESWRENITQMPVHIAAENGSLEMLKLLKQYKADLNTSDIKKGRTPLHYAAAYGYTDIAEYLLENGVEFDLTDNYQMTPIDLANRYGNEDISTLLIEYGADQSTIPSELISLKPNDSRIIYTGHSGWVVETADHILIFDYWKRAEPSAEASIKSGCLTRDYLDCNKQVSFLVSHDHQDHYDQRIFQFADLPNVEYIFGFQPRSQQTITVLNAHEPYLRDNFEIYPIYSNDSGVGFLVEVDGLVIFHAGDHANRNRDLSGNYLPEVEYLNSLNKHIDLAFMPVSGCNFGDNEAVRIGIYKTLDILAPEYFIPMHAGSDESKLMQFNYRLAQDGYELDKFSAKDPGDRFLYSY